MRDSVGSAIREMFSSPNVTDRNFEKANIVDVIDRLALAIYALAAAINKDKA